MAFTNTTPRERAAQFVFTNAILPEPAHNLHKRRKSSRAGCSFYLHRRHVSCCLLPARASGFLSLKGKTLHTLSTSSNPPSSLLSSFQTPRSLAKHSGHGPSEEQLAEQRQEKQAETSVAEVMKKMTDAAQASQHAFTLSGFTDESEVITEFKLTVEQLKRQLQLHTLDKDELEAVLAKFLSVQTSVQNMVGFVKQSSGWVKALLPLLSLRDELFELLCQSNSLAKAPQTPGNTPAYTAKSVVNTPTPTNPAPQSPGKTPAFFGSRPVPELSNVQQDTEKEEDEEVQRAEDLKKRQDEEKKQNDAEQKQKDEKAAAEKKRQDEEVQRAQDRIKRQEEDDKLKTKMVADMKDEFKTIVVNWNKIEGDIPVNPSALLQYVELAVRLHRVDGLPMPDYLLPKYVEEAIWISHKDEQQYKPEGTPSNRMQEYYERVAFGKVFSLIRSACRTSEIQRSAPPPTHSRALASRLAPSETKFNMAEKS